MRAFSTPLLAALLLAAAVSPSLAATTPPHPAGAPRAATGVTADLQCLMTMVAFGQDKSRSQAGQVGAYFFLGRINARAPGFNLAAAMKAEAPSMGPQQLQANLKRCGPMVAAGSQSLQGALNGLRPAGAPAAAAPAAPAPTATPTPAPAPK